MSQNFSHVKIVRTSKSHKSVDMRSEMLTRVYFWRHKMLTSCMTPHQKFSHRKKAPKVLTDSKKCWPGCLFSPQNVDQLHEPSPKFSHHKKTPKVLTGSKKCLPGCIFSPRNVVKWYDPVPKFFVPQKSPKSVDQQYKMLTRVNNFFLFWIYGTFGARSAPKNF